MDKLHSASPCLFLSWSPYARSPQQEGGSVSTDRLGWDSWEARGLNWRELGLIEGREARCVGVPSSQVHLREGYPLKL